MLRHRDIEGVLAEPRVHGVGLALFDHADSGERDDGRVFGLTSGLLPPYPGGMGYRRFITMEPGKRGGKPCVRGLRITVYDVLDYLASGMTEAQILADFPDLTADDIRACLAFAADRERRLASVPPV